MGKELKKTLTLKMFAMNQNNLNSFLHFGFFSDYNNSEISFDLNLVLKRKIELQSVSAEEKRFIAKRDWLQNFENLYFEGEHVVPISGGMDSRAILASLLHFTNASDIHTYTFGTPGTYDFEIGNLIGKKLGTKHKAFPFTDYKYTTDKEIEISKRIEHQTFLFHHPDLDLIDQHYQDKTLWSGAMMDWLTGSYIPTQRNSTLIEAKDDIIKRGAFSNNLSMVTDIDNLRDNIVDMDLIPNNILSFEEQLQIKNFLPKMEAPHILYKKLNYIVPAKSPEFYSFYLSLSPEERFRQKFYGDFLHREFPSLFALPIKVFHGLSPNGSKLKLGYRRVKHRIITSLNAVYPIIFNPHLNYLDFNEGIRKRKDLNEVVFDNIVDLKDRKIVPWINIEKIYKDHMGRKRNHADALLLLASLEIHLKAGKQI